MSDNPSRPSALRIIGYAFAGTLAGLVVGYAVFRLALGLGLLVPPETRDDVYGIGRFISTWTRASLVMLPTGGLGAIVGAILGRRVRPGAR